MQRRVREAMRYGLVLSLFVALLATTASAHEIRPAIVTVSFPAGDRVEILISANLEALMAGIGAEHKDSNDAPEATAYNTLRALPPGELATRFRAFAPRYLSGLSASFDGARATLAIASIDVPDIRETSLARISSLRLEGQRPPAARTFQWSYPRTFGSSVLRTRSTGQAPQSAAVRS